MTSRTPSPSALLVALVLAAPASAERLVLVPRHQPGDAYLLTLGTTVETRSSSRGAALRAVEDVRLVYEAAVVVLETDGDGHALRERHERVRLRSERPDGTRSLFREGAGFEVRRDGDALRLFAGEDGDQRLDREVERVVGELLGGRLAATRLPALLDPGRPVEVGETWTLDPRLVRRTLGDRGLRILGLDEPAHATLAREGGAEGGLVVRYEVPVAWLEPREMPLGARAAASDGRLAGELRLGADPRSRAHSSRLALRMHGVVTRGGVAPAFPWRLESTMRTAERTQLLGKLVVSGL